MRKPDYGALGPYFAGRKLYGDDFSPNQIAAWYEDEREGYAGLVARGGSEYRYAYHALNRLHGFRYLPERRFRRALGIGSAYGDEFAPLADWVDEVTILEPSERFSGGDVHGIPARWIKPRVDGMIPFPDGHFDLITCLGVLHHVPNVTRVVREMHRCLSPDGWALVREPVVSMGDWRGPRPGLTKRERGIPMPIFRQILASAGFRIVHAAPCVFPLVPKIWHAFGREAFNSPLATRLDSILSRVLRYNLRYHADTFARKFRPVAVYLVLNR